MTLIGNINITERENPVRMTVFEETDRIFLNPEFRDDWRIRTEIRQRIEKASLTLPDGLGFMIYEAYRSRQQQQRLWDPLYARLQRENPDWPEDDLYTEAARWISPPDGIGSGHQAGAAVDITLATLDRHPLDMGTDMNAKSTPLTMTASPVAENIRKNRNILITALAKYGLANYPDEWWHFSYGDRLWAEVTERTQAFFAPIDYDSKDRVILPQQNTADIF
jgi:D-alanyl-D-alanine dipeptidase